MPFTQAEIDAADVYYELHNNPGGGNGDDYTAICTVAEDPNCSGEPLWWQSGDDETAEEFVRHKIGLIRAPNESVAFVVCTAKTSFTLTIPSFSEVSDEVIVHRVFCAALRPTSSGFTFANPIKDITVAASPDTVNVQTVALDAYKTVKATDTVTVTHTQDFPCIFGICYKHKSKGEIVYDGSTPVIPDPEVETTVPNVISFSFSAPDAINYLQRSVEIPSGTVSGLYLVMNDSASKKCYRLRISYLYSDGMSIRECEDDIVVEHHNLIIGDNWTLNDLLYEGMRYRTFSESTVFNIELTVPELEDDLVLQFYYTNTYKND